MLPLVMGMALGKKKNLTKQESTRAGLMSYAGASVGGSAGALLGTVSAVNAEAIEKKLKESDRQLAQVSRERNVLLDSITVDGNSRIQITSSPAVEALLKQFNKYPASNGSSTHNADGPKALSNTPTGSIKQEANGAASTLSSDKSGVPDAIAHLDDTLVTISQSLRDLVAWQNKMWALVGKNFQEPGTYAPEELKTGNKAPVVPDTKPVGAKG